MNERIKQLWEESTGATVPGEGFYSSASKFNIEKFAELIVLECEKVAKDPQWYDKSPSNGWRRPIQYVCMVMKEHFGVK